LLLNKHTKHTLQKENYSLKKLSLFAQVQNTDHEIIRAWEGVPGAVRGLLAITGTTAMLLVGSADDSNTNTHTENIKNCVACNDGMHCSKDVNTK
jgi:hypothetical protein